jgi:S1-C subfamily serine protease
MNATNVFRVIVLNCLIIPCGCSQANDAANITNTAPAKPTTMTHDITEKSRDNCVLIRTDAGSGTGFWLTQQHIATCWHVIGKLAVDDPKPPSGFHTVHSNQQGTQTFYVNVADNIKITTLTGEVLDAELVSIPVKSYGDAAPANLDFAILKTMTISTNTHITAVLAPSAVTTQVGDVILFSGYPLDTAANVGMVTLQGQICGQNADKSLIGIQGPVNSGNSCGAALNIGGQVIGIITAKEGRLLGQLEADRARIAATRKSASITIMGTDPNAAIYDLTDTLLAYISPGIGYARNISNLRDYCERHPDVLK